MRISPTRTTSMPRITSKRRPRRTRNTTPQRASNLRTRPLLGALLLACYDPGGRLVHAGRRSIGIKQSESKGCGESCSRSLSPRCRLRYRRRAPVVSDRRSCSATFIGCGPSSSPRSNFYLDRRQAAAAGGLRRSRWLRNFKPSRRQNRNLAYQSDHAPGSSKLNISA
jgi:hypothetical protein